jgi:TRAP-type C4-dicarboxylate transport system substrate-binding protein
MKRHYLLVFIILACIIFGGFVRSAPLLAQTSSSVITLKYGSWIPGPPHWFGRCVTWYLDEVEKRTEGRVKFKRYWSKTLAGAGQLLEATQSGLVDVAMISAAYYGAKLPLLSLGQVPGLYDYVYDAHLAIYDLYNSSNNVSKAMRAELAQYKVRYLSSAPTSPYYLLTKKLVTSLEDMKGLKIVATGATGKAIESLGAVPVKITGPEIYNALQKGIVDGVVYGLATALNYSLQETAKYYYMLPFGQHWLILGINNKSWEKLPVNIQKIMDEVAIENAKSFQAIYQEEGDAAALRKFADAKVTITKPTENSKEKYQKFLYSSVWEEWIKEREKKGLPAGETLQFFLERVKFHHQSNPFIKK